MKKKKREIGQLPRSTSGSSCCVEKKYFDNSLIPAATKDSAHLFAMTVIRDLCRCTGTEPVEREKNEWNSGKMVGVGCVITRAALSPSDTADIFGKKKQLNIFRTKDEIFNFSEFQIKSSNFVSFAE